MHCKISGKAALIELMLERHSLFRNLGMHWPYCGAKIYSFIILIISYYSLSIITDEDSVPLAMLKLKFVHLKNDWLRLIWAQNILAYVDQAYVDIVSCYWQLPLMLYIVIVMTKSLHETGNLYLKSYVSINLLSSLDTFLISFAFFSKLIKIMNVLLLLL